MKFQIWSIDYGNANFTLHGHMSNVRCLDYFRHGDAQILTAGFDDETAEVWNYLLQRTHTKSCDT